MRTYRATVTETLQMTARVEAWLPRSGAPCRKQWMNGDHVLDTDRFTDVTFRAEPRQRKRDYER
jgi:hypothetical protein